MRTKENVDIGANTSHVMNSTLGIDVLSRKKGKSMSKNCCYVSPDVRLNFSVVSDPVLIRTSSHCTRDLLEHGTLEEVQSGLLIPNGRKCLRIVHCYCWTGAGAGGCGGAGTPGGTTGGAGEAGGATGGAGGEAC